MIENLIDIYNLKEEKRTGWELRKVTDPETVADHSWGTAFLSLIYADQEDLNQDKAVKMALIHDLGEAEIGDIPYRKAGEKRNAEEKQRKEESAMKTFGKNLDSKEVVRLWEEYEEKQTVVAKFVKDMDIIDLCLTALKYEKGNRYNPDEDNENFREYENMDEFFATTQERLSTKTGKELFTDIKARYQQAKKE